MKNDRVSPEVSFSVVLSVGEDGEIPTGPSGGPDAPRYPFGVTSLLVPRGPPPRPSTGHGRVDVLSCGPGFPTTPGPVHFPPDSCGRTGTPCVSGETSVRSSGVH